MAGTKSTGEGVSAFSDLEKEVLASTDAFVEKTVLLSGNTRDEGGSTDAQLDAGYALVRVKSSGASGGTVVASDIDKFREFNSSDPDLDEPQDVVVLASTVDLSEHSGDLQVPVIVMGLLDADDTFNRGTLDYKNNHRLHEWPL